MGYIWSDYSKEKSYRISTKNISPYMEIWDNSEKTVLVNIFFRLFDMLIPYDEKETDNKEKEINRLLDLYENDARYSEIANCILHYLAQTDLYKGLSYKDLWTYNIYSAIEMGQYGTTASSKFGKLNGKDKLTVCSYIAEYEISKGRANQFDSALNALFQRVQIYYEKSTSIVRIYIGEEKNEYNKNLFEIICYFLSDYLLEYSVHWKHEHFGVIGVEETMQIGEIALI